MSRLREIAAVVVFAMLFGCGGGSPESAVGTSAGSSPCSGGCVNAQSSLSADDVKTVLAQAIAEASARGVSATIAVVDRVGNVLAVYRMQPQAVTISTSPDGGTAIDGGLEGISIDPAALGVAIDDQAAIAKAITAAYLSTEGNAFSTRTANQIVQEHFNPGETGQPGGPLFGVQFSQLACSDFTRSVADAGPKHSPLGLSADPGGLPLYKDGVPVGGLGVIADGRYSIDPVITDLDEDLDELVALSGTFGFAAPNDRRADRITVEGKTLRFSDAGFADLLGDPALAQDFDTIPPAVGQLIAVPGYSGGAIIPGVVFGDAASGVRADALDYPGLDAFVFVDNADAERYRPGSGTDAVQLAGSGENPLTAQEVRQVISSALAVANGSRAQIRRPVGSIARVTVSVVDTNGEILGIARSRDAPVFGADVSLQKARTATLFSSANAAAFLDSLPDTRYLDINDGGLSIRKSVDIADYVPALRDFLGVPAALSDGAFAFSDRAGGNLSRPFYPDGIDGAVNGPLSKPAGEWSPFSTGLQLDLVLNAVLQHVLFTAGAIAAPVGSNCAGVSISDDLSAFAATSPGLNAANGLQIFPGSVPIYRGSTLVGGIGVSGDGVDQDDMIAFLGIHDAAALLNGSINNAPVAMRPDNLAPQGTRLRFIQCPQSPFINSDAQNVCAGK